VVFNHATLAQRSVHESWSGGILPYTVLDQTILTLGCTFPVASIAGFMVAAGFLAGRFSSTWPAARAVVQTILGRYIAWSILGFLALGVLKRRFAIEEVFSSLVGYFGPFPAYWFFASLILFSLLAPWLTALAKHRPYVLLAIFVISEGIRSTIFYSRAPVSNLLTPLQGSYYILGVLLSQHSAAAVKRLMPHKNRILAAAMVMLGAACVETTYWWNAAGFPDGNAISADRTALRLYAILITTWFLLRETRPSILATWLDRVGMKSLAVFLTFDFFQWCAYAILWHLPALSSHEVLSHSSAPPNFLSNPGWILLYLAVGLAGPLSAVAAVEHFGGKQRRQVIFG